MLTHERLLEVLHYNPETGKLLWRIRKATKIDIGDEAGWITEDGYRRIEIDGKQYYAGPLAFFYMEGRWPDPEVDHKNRQRADNKWLNLREATSLQNASNRKTRKRTENLPPFINHDHGRFRVRRTINKKRYNIGSFGTVGEAQQAYLDFMNQHGGI